MNWLAEMYGLSVDQVISVAEVAAVLVFTPLTVLALVIWTSRRRFHAP